MKRLSNAAALVALFLLPTLLAYFPSMVLAQQELVGEETTVLMEPLRDNGTVDYAKALNQKFQVPATENFVVGILKYSNKLANSPKEYKHRFAESVGLTKFPEQISWNDPMSFLEEEWQGDGLLTEKSLLANIELNRPWTRQQYPKLALYLDEKQEFFESLIQASKRPGYYLPRLHRNNKNNASARNSDKTTSHTPLMSCDIYVCMDISRICRALAVYANFKIGEGEIVSAIETTQAIRRIGWHCQNGLSLTEKLIGITIQNNAFFCELDLLNSQKMNAQQLALYQSFLNDRPLNSMVPILNYSERFIVLDLVQVTHLVGVDYLSKLGRLDVDESVAAALKTEEIDYKLVLRSCNQYFDRLVLAMNKKTYSARKKALDNITAELEKSRTQHFDENASHETLAGRSQYVAHEFIAIFTPAMILKVENALLRQKVNEDLVIVAMAVERFRLANENTAEHLDLLVPEFLDELPNCQITEQTFKYLRKGKGFAVYSVGFDKIDDGGATNAELDPNQMTYPLHLAGDIRVAVKLNFNPARGSEEERIQARHRSLKESVFADPKTKQRKQTDNRRFKKRIR